MKTKIILLALIALVSLSGCTIIKYQDPSGATFHSTSFLNRRNIDKVEAKAGEKSLVIQGYANDQAELAAAVASSVAKALTPAAK